MNWWAMWHMGHLVFSSPELKAQVSFSGHLWSVVRLYVKLSTFFIFFSRTTGPFSNKLGTKHPRVVGLQVSWNEGSRPFPSGDNYEIAKTYWRNLKIFSRTTGPISTKLGTKHPWVKEIQVCSNEGPRPFPRGDNYEIAKIHWRN